MEKSVTRQVLELQSKSLKELRQMWQDLYLTDPPPQPAAYLRPRLAYRLQELALGGLSAKTQRQLEQLADTLDPKTLEPKRPLDSRLLPGTRLIREWQGVKHEVEVMQTGFNYQGQRYKSLSAIARTITGTQWSGPLFFGLKRNT